MIFPYNNTSYMMRLNICIYYNCGVGQYMHPFSNTEAVFASGLNCLENAVTLLSLVPSRMFLFEQKVGPEREQVGTVAVRNGTILSRAHVELDVHPL